MVPVRANLQPVLRRHVLWVVQQRSLHLTGAVKHPSYVLGTEKPPVSDIPKDIAGLRAACRQFGLNTNGSKADLTERLNTHSIRSFSVSPSKRPNTDNINSSNSRSFNTSRELRKPGDNSTIDFMYFPSEAALNPDVPTIMRVPILPDSEVTRRVDIYGHQAEELSVQKPTITVIGGESTHISSPSAMAEVHDNSASADNTDVLSEIVDQVSEAARQVASGAAEQGERAGGIAKQLWTGFVEDVFGAKSKRSYA